MADAMKLPVKALLFVVRPARQGVADTPAQSKARWDPQRKFVR